MQKTMSLTLTETNIKVSENSSENGATKTTTQEISQQDLVLITKRLREKENLENPPKRRSTRSTRNTRSMAESDVLAPLDVQNSPEKKLPYIRYKGGIKYFTEWREIAESADTITQWIDKQAHEEFVPVAFDMEWPFSFQTGPGKSAVIQICVEEKCCWVFQLSNLKKIPPALLVLLKHPRIKLHGVNIKNDFRKLARDFAEVDADELIEKCIDLGVWYNQIHETGGRWSLERLANVVVEKAMDKSKKIRMSKWHVIPLDENQLMYAAIDVYIGQVIFRKLQGLEKIKAANEKEFLEKNGESAFKAVKALGETFLTKRDDLTI